MSWIPVVNSGSPPSIDIKYLLTSNIWRDCADITDVMSKISKFVKIVKIKGFRHFVAKVCTYVVVIQVGVWVHLGVVVVKINSIKYKRCKYLLNKTFFVCFSHWKVQALSQWPSPYNLRHVKKSPYNYNASLFIL